MGSTLVNGMTRCTKLSYPRHTWLAFPNWMFVHLFRSKRPAALPQDCVAHPRMNSRSNSRGMFRRFAATTIRKSTNMCHAMAGWPVSRNPTDATANDRRIRSSGSRSTGVQSPNSSFRSHLQRRWARAASALRRSASASRRRGSGPASFPARRLVLVAGAVLTVGGDDRVIRPCRCPPESSEGGGGRGPDRGADPSDRARAPAARVCSAEGRGRSRSRPCLSATRSPSLIATVGQTPYPGHPQAAAVGFRGYP